MRTSHAAREEEPILTAEQRVNRAMKSVMAGKEFNEEQVKWLGFIREHLITNLTLDLSDFRTAPIFEIRGGLGRARILFGDELEALIEQVNFAIAA